MGSEVAFGYERFLIDIMAVMWFLFLSCMLLDVVTCCIEQESAEGSREPASHELHLQCWVLLLHKELARQQVTKSLQIGV
jgi:hypothetical protein